MDALSNIIFGVAGNFVHEWLKSLHAKLNNKAWDELYIDAHVAAARYIRGFGSSKSGPAINVDRDLLYQA